MVSWRMAVRIAALVQLMTACATWRVRPDFHQEGWLLVETPHIALRTDLEPGAAQRRATELEAYWQALAQMYGVVVPGAPAPQGPFPVIHFEACGDLTRVPHPGGSHGGFVFSSLHWLSEPIAVTCDLRGDSLLIHELAHVFNDHYFSRMPTWVNEGLATYYSSLTVRGGTAVVGSLPAGLLTACPSMAWLPTLDAIRRMDHEQFHERRGEACNYLSAWKLVHLLSTSGPEREQRFRSYLAALAHADTSEDAWTRAFGDLPAEALANDYSEYHRRRRLSGWTAPFEAEPARPRLRRLRPGEAHILWINLLASGGDRVAVAAQLERLAAVDPGWPELPYWRAVLLQPPDALQLLREYLTRRPEDGRAWRALVRIELDRALPPDYLGLDAEPPAGLAAIGPDVWQLILHSDDPPSLNLIGWYFAARQNAVAGLHFAVRAVERAPACGGCWDTVGLLYFEAGKIAEAVRAQERAVGLYGEDASPAMLARLRRYRGANAASK